MFYTASYIEKLIGLPVSECVKRCTRSGRRYDLEDARRAKAQYDAERALAISIRRNLMDQHLCIHHVGNGYCSKPAATTGVPYCEEHLPPSHKRRCNKEQ